MNVINAPRRGRQRRGPTEDAPLAAPYKVPDQEIFAVEHPMIIQNLDRALKTFGNNRPFRRILDSDDPEECLPLYLRPADPMCAPVLSVNAPTTNVVVQITVPKRTGRKRKRGSDGPFTFSGRSEEAEDTQDSVATIDPHSRVRGDDPAMLRKMMQDNVDTYSCEVVGKIRHTHRYRGISDFQQSTSSGIFVPKMKETLLQGNWSGIQKFDLDLKMGVTPGGEILPPPVFTSHSVPFNWSWEQNPLIYRDTDELTGKKQLINASENRVLTAKYIHRDVPTVPTRGPSVMPTEGNVLSLIESLEEAFSERPAWTRRGLLNRLGHLPSFYLLRNALPYVGYMFKGGPFRDVIIKYGFDPRKDSRYRGYQTMFFKLFSADDDKHAGDAWEDLRTTNRIVKPGELRAPDTHIFNGVDLTLDGKVWQICDVVDPLLKRLIDEAPVRETFDQSVDGWFTSGRLAKIKAIMKVKLVALRTGKTVTDKDFADALAYDDVVVNKNHRNVHVPVPDLRLTESEIKDLEEKGVDLTNLGITYLRRTEGSRNVMAKQARGSKEFIPRGKKGRYTRKETTALIEGGVDNAIQKIDKRKNRNQQRVPAARPRKGAHGMVLPGESIMDSVEAGPGFGNEAEEEDDKEDDDDDEDDDTDEEVPTMRRPRRTVPVSGSFVNIAPRAED